MEFIVREELELAVAFVRGGMLWGWVTKRSLGPVRSTPVGKGVL